VTGANQELGAGTKREPYLFGYDIEAARPASSIALCPLIARIRRPTASWLTSFTPGILTCRPARGGHNL